MKPLYKKIEDRARRYIYKTTSQDAVLDMMGRDFPYLEEKLTHEYGEQAVIHYGITLDNHLIATLKKLAVLHSKDLFKPFHSHKCSRFHLKDDEDIYLAILMENPYHIASHDAVLKYSIHVDGIPIELLEHKIESKSFRNTYFIPLKILSNGMMDGQKRKKFTISVQNENTLGCLHTTEVEVLYGGEDPSETFEMDRCYLHQEGEDYQRRVNNLETLESIYVKAEIEYDGSYGEFDELEMTARISRTEGEAEDDLMTKVVMTADPDSPGRFIVDAKLFDYMKIDFRSQVPCFEPEPGQYTVELSVLGHTIWSDEIEFSGQEAEEFDIPMGNPTGPIFTEDELENTVEQIFAEVAEKTAEEDAVRSKIDHSRPFDYLDILGLKLFKTGLDSDMVDQSFNYMALTPQTAFDKSGLKTIAVVGDIWDLKCDGTFNDPISFTVHLLDQTGRELRAKCGLQSRNADVIEIYCGFGDFCRYNWEKGTYTLEIKWDFHTVASATFTVGDVDNHSEYDPAVIRYRNNVVAIETDGSALEKLERMAGLEEVKDKVHEFMNYAYMKKQREAAGLPTKMPSLHARFIGNPGTGKTTVARLIGQIYKELGLLSSGHVLLMERRDFVGKYYDSEKTAVDNALAKAKGGILLIDEAYNLYVKDDTKDPGRKVIEYLLTALADEENRDWMLVLAGYPDAMEDMLNCNQGLASRVDTVFNFADCDIDTLMKIAELYCEENRYELSDDAKARLHSVITKDYETRDRNFGNGRYVKKLMETAIYTKMAQRLRGIASPSLDQLVTIEPEDIPISQEEYERIAMGKFDEKAIDAALKRLDSLVGLYKVKSAIHNFVHIARYLSSRKERFTGKGLLKWNFAGNTGTGKSTVAQILADILQAMNLIQKNEVTELKGEEIFNVSDYTCNEILRETAKKSRRGLLFIDGDAPEFRSNEYRLSSEQIRFKLASLVADERSTGALVIGECSTGSRSLAHNLASNGVYDYDHTFIFDDYTADELYQILLQCLGKYGLTMSEDAEKTIREYIAHLCENREKSFANARTMKNLSRAIFDITMLRLSTCGNPGTEKIVSSEDVESFVWKNMEKKIGYL